MTGWSTKLFPAPNPHKTVAHQKAFLPPISLKENKPKRNVFKGLFNSKNNDEPLDLFELVNVAQQELDVKQKQFVETFTLPDKKQFFDPLAVMENTHEFKKASE